MLNLQEIISSVDQLSADDKEYLFKVLKERLMEDQKDFWSALQDFRQRVDLESIDDDTFENLRDKSIGRDVEL